MLSFPFQTFSLVLSLCLFYTCTLLEMISPRPMASTCWWLITFYPSFGLSSVHQASSPPSYISACISNRHLRLNTLKIDLFIPVSLKTCIPLPLTNLLPLFTISAFLSLRQFLLLIHQQFCWLLFLNIPLFLPNFPAVTLIQVYRVLPDEGASLPNIHFSLSLAPTQQANSFKI